jgi:hypothetical protein
MAAFYRTNEGGPTTVEMPTTVAQPTATMIANAIAAGVALVAQPSLLGDTAVISLGPDQTEEKTAVSGDTLTQRRKTWRRLDTGLDLGLIMHTKRVRKQMVRDT